MTCTKVAIPATIYRSTQGPTPESARCLEAQKKHSGGALSGLGSWHSSQWRPGSQHKGLKYPTYDGFLCTFPWSVIRIRMNFGTKKPPALFRYIIRRTFLSFFSRAFLVFPCCKGGGPVCHCLRAFSLLLPRFCSVHCSLRRCSHLLTALLFLDQLTPASKGGFCAICGFPQEAANKQKTP